MLIITEYLIIASPFSCETLSRQATPKDQPRPTIATALTSGSYVVLANRGVWLHDFGDQAENDGSVLVLPPGTCTLKPIPICFPNSSHYVPLSMAETLVDGRLVVIKIAVDTHDATPRRPARLSPASPPAGEPPCEPRGRHAYLLGLRRLEAWSHLGNRTSDWQDMTTDEW